LFSIMSVFATFKILFGLIATFWDRGGWILFLFVGLYMLWVVNLFYQQQKFFRAQKWIMLSMDVPKENEQTFLAMEQVFAQLHAIHLGFTFYETYFQGKFVLWFTFDIVSFGGQIKYLVYLPQQYRDLMEAAIYAQYPDAQIKQVEDYMRNVPQYDPKKSYYDVWGTEYNLDKEDAYPIRTYKFFEHQASQIIVDPMSGVLEALATIKPYELMAVQYMFQPVNDDWKEKGRQLIKKLKKEKEEKKTLGFASDVGGRVLGGLAGIAAGPVDQAQALPPAQQEYEPPSLMMHLAPGEKDVIAAVEASLGKIGYKTKIRMLYLTPKDKFRKDAKIALVGSFRQFDDINLNGFKPDLGKTWTKIEPKFYEPLERPFIKFFTGWRKRRLIRYYKSRKFRMGQKPFILNIEEAATIFHFPLLTVKAPKLTKTEIKKGEAPINLPV